MRGHFFDLVILALVAGSIGCAHPSKTDYGHGVAYVGGAGAGGADANLTSRTVDYSPSAGHAIIASAYTCSDSNVWDFAGDL
jgi:hypothetical protein